MVVKRVVERGLGRLACQIWYEKHMIAFGGSEAGGQLRQVAVAQWGR